LVLLHDCIACQHGDHSEHVEHPEVAPAGMMGGWSCPCTGDCAERNKNRRSIIDDIIPMVPMGPENNIFTGSYDMPRPGAVVKINKPHTYLHNAYTRAASAREELQELLKLDNLTDEDKEAFNSLYHQTRKLAEALDRTRTMYSKGIRVQEVEGDAIEQQSDNGDKTPDAEEQTPPIPPAAS